MATLCAAAFRGATAAAQTSPPLPAPEAPTASPVGALVLAAGTNVGGFDHVAGRALHGVAAQLGYERHVGGTTSRFALRLGGDYWRAGGGTYTPYNAADPAHSYTYHRTTTIVGGSVLGIAHLPAVSVVRPYALVSIGVFRYTGRNVADLAGGGQVIDDAPNGNPDHWTAFGYGGGLGAAVRLGPIRPFAEVHVIQMTGTGDVGVVSTRAPLTFGLRF